MKLHDVHVGIKKNKKRKRVGRGPGSGHGKTSGRGHKGQGQLAGWSASPIFEGGASPLIRRIPKRGFRSRTARTHCEVRLNELNGLESPVTLLGLIAAGVVPQGTAKAKVILSGTLSQAITLEGVAVTAGARAAIEALGGIIKES